MAKNFVTVGDRFSQHIHVYYLFPCKGDVAMDQSPLLPFQFKLWSKHVFVDHLQLSLIQLWNIVLFNFNGNKCSTYQSAVHWYREGRWWMIGWVGHGVYDIIEVQVCSLKQNSQRIVCYILRCNPFSVQKMSQLVGMVVSVKLSLFSFFYVTFSWFMNDNAKKLHLDFILYLNMFLKGRVCGQSVFSVDIFNYVLLLKLFNTWRPLTLYLHLWSNLCDINLICLLPRYTTPPFSPGNTFKFLGLYRYESIPKSDRVIIFKFDSTSCFLSYQKLYLVMMGWW